MSIEDINTSGTPAIHRAGQRGPANAQRTSRARAVVCEVQPVCGMKLLIPLAAAIALSTAACAVDSGPDARADTDETPEHLGQTAQQVTIITCTGPAFSLFRYYSGLATDHFYTTNFNELGNGAGGYALEGTAGTLFSSIFQACGAVPLYRFYNAAGTD